MIRISKEKIAEKVVDIGSRYACRKCGKTFSRPKGYFAVSYSQLNKGIGYMPYCRDCVDEMYDAFLAECRDAKKAVRQMCRKLDLYWNEKLFEQMSLATTSTRSMMTNYLSRVSTVKHMGMCYDDTLREEKALWIFPEEYGKKKTSESYVDPEDEGVSVPEDIVAFWGPGYSPTAYLDLNERYKYWENRLPNGVDKNDIGVQALLRQITSLEIEINKERAGGGKTDRLVNTLNSLLGSAMLKPVQKKEDMSSVEGTPLGMWIYRYENERPLPEPDKEFKDVNGIYKYVTTWVYGHLAKMLGVKNAYSKLYEQEMKRLRVEKPEYKDEDDDSFLYDALGGNDT